MRKSQKCYPDQDSRLRKELITKARKPRVFLPNAPDLFQQMANLGAVGTNRKLILLVTCCILISVAHSSEKADKTKNTALEKPIGSKHTAKEIQLLYAAHTGCQSKDYQSVQKETGISLGKLFNIGEFYIKQERVPQNIEYAKHSGYFKQYQKDPIYYKKELEKELGRIIANSHLSALREMADVFSIDPSGLKKDILLGADGYTYFVKRHIFIDMKIIDQGGVRLRAALANELQHMFVILTNEISQGEKITEKNFPGRKNNREKFPSHA